MDSRELDVRFRTIENEIYRLKGSNSNIQDTINIDGNRILNGNYIPLNNMYINGKLHDSPSGHIGNIEDAIRILTTYIYHLEDKIMHMENTIEVVTEKIDTVDSRMYGSKIKIVGGE